ncbi:BMP family lipoprotein [Spirochaeta cellobiosiphila]|uniref:BMP family lipoprotein n=1 Tax=Spirochaeta cellobiosiphila TaxID=504483 RepID=UPI000A00FBE6|nr:BMP family ABC transporter substrate-binding protein [Spirochaeta cellobiosiphila]
MTLCLAGGLFANGAQEGSAKKGLKVGMVTDSGTIDDKSFNQGTWEGILKAQENYGIAPKYLKPVGTTEADYLKEIGNLYDAGFKFIVTPGFKFESAIFAAQDKYADAKFVIIDGEPHSADYSEYRINDNVVAIYFSEQESGFVAAVAAALQMKEAEFGFIGGMEIPAVQKFNWGFQQGLKYANENLGTKITLNPENVIYQGTFDDVAGGQQIAAQMYAKGVKVIFTAAGGVGIGAINEAKTRVKAGSDVWVIGVDSDQYNDGIYEGTKSVILTSAMKRVDVVTTEMVAAELEGSFPGGQVLRYDATHNAVGIPQENPNLSEDVQAQVASVFAKLQAGAITVSAEQGDLIK